MSHRAAEAGVNLVRIWDTSHMTDKKGPFKRPAGPGRLMGAVGFMARRSSCVNGLRVKCKLCRSAQSGVMPSK